MRKILIGLMTALGLISQAHAGEQDGAIPPGWSLSPEYQQHQKQERQKQQSKQQQSKDVNNARNVLMQGGPLADLIGPNDRLLEEITFVGTCRIKIEESFDFNHEESNGLRSLGFSVVEHLHWILNGKRFEPNGLIPE